MKKVILALMLFATLAIANQTQAASRPIGQKLFNVRWEVVEDWTDVNGCHIHAVKTYELDMWNQVTLVNFTYSRTCPE